jgi:hypothetical protein
VIQQHLALKKYPARSFASLSVGDATQVFAQFATDSRENLVAILRRDTANEVNLRVILLVRLHE